MIARILSSATSFRETSLEPDSSLLDEFIQSVSVLRFDARTPGDHSEEDGDKTAKTSGASSCRHKHPQEVKADPGQCSRLPLCNHRVPQCNTVTIYFPL